MTTPHIMAVPEMAQAGAGAITYWRLSSKPVEHAALVAAWAQARLPVGLLLSTPEPATALRRTVADLRGARRLVRSVRGTHVIVDETPNAKTVERPSDVEYTPQATVSLDKVGRVVVAPAHKTVLRDEIAAQYERMLGLLLDSDFSSWFATKLIPFVQGVSLRPSGGMYFVPRAQVETWTRIVDAIRAVSDHRVFSIPAMESTEAVAAIVDAIQQEATAEADDIAKDLNAGKLGTDALDTRVDRTKAMAAKVERYETLLGVKLDEMRDRLTELHAQLTVAAAKAEGLRDAC